MAFSCGLGVHLRTCSEFYSAQSFGGVVGLAFVSLPSLPVVSVCYRLGLGWGCTSVGVRVSDWVKVRVSSMSYLLIIFSTELLVSV